MMTHFFCKFYIFTSLEPFSGSMLINRSLMLCMIPDSNDYERM
jgi:hypothetical protein